MPDSLARPPVLIEDLIRKLRNEGKVPLGVFSYDVENDAFQLFTFPELDSEEVSALLEKLRLRFTVTK